MNTHDYSGIRQIKALRCSSRRDRQRGFSVIEVLVAAVVVAVGLLGAAKFQAKMIKTGVSVKDRTLALSAAQEKIEMYRIDYAHSMNIGQQQYSDTPSFYTGSTGALSRSWTIDAFNAPKYDAINVQVDWQDSYGDTSTVSLASYVAAGNPVMSSRKLWVSQNPYQTPPSPPQSPPTTPTSYNAIISGTIYQLNGNASWTLSADKGVCEFTGNSYACIVAGVPIDAVTDITFTFSPDDTPCVTGPVTVSLSSSVTSATQDFYHGANTSKCP